MSAITEKLSKVNESFTVNRYDNVQETLTLPLAD